MRLGGVSMQPYYALLFWESVVATRTFCTREFGFYGCRSNIGNKGWNEDKQERTKPHHETVFICFHSFLHVLTFPPVVCRCCLWWCDSNAQWLSRHPIPSRKVCWLIDLFIYFLCNSDLSREKSHWYDHFKTGSVARLFIYKAHCIFLIFY